MAGFAAWVSMGMVGLLSLAALVTAIALLTRRGRDRAQHLLATRLVGSIVLVAALAALSWDLIDPPGSLQELIGFTLALAGVSLHLLDVPFALARTRDWQPPRWIAALPLVLPAGLLAYASMHWPASTMPAGVLPSEWAGWAGRDAVEDAAGGTGTITLGVVILAATTVLLLGAMRASGTKRARARRMLVQAWAPAVAWLVTTGLVVLALAIQDPPASPVFHIVQEILLDGPIVFALVIVGPLLWGLDELGGAGFLVELSSREGQPAS